jgi:hypothetical protein
MNSSLNSALAFIYSITQAVMIQQFIIFSTRSKSKKRTQRPIVDYAALAILSISQLKTSYLARTLINGFESIPLLKTLLISKIYKKAGSRRAL